jgi:hypothetical protein
MATESVRRKVIVKNYNCGISKDYKHSLRETKHTSGSAGGVLEAFMLSGYCPTIVAQAIAGDSCDVFDGGRSSDEFTTIMDGNNNGLYLDGGSATDEYVNTLDGTGNTIYDGGYQSRYLDAILNGGYAITECAT